MFLSNIENKKVVFNTNQILLLFKILKFIKIKNISKPKLFSKIKVKQTAFGIEKSKVQHNLVSYVLKINLTKKAFTISSLENNKQITGFFEKGKKTGEWNYFFTNGNLKYKESYSNEESLLIFSTHALLLLLFAHWHWPHFQHRGGRNKRANSTSPMRSTNNTLISIDI